MFSFYRGLTIKDVSSQGGEGGVVQCGYFSDKKESGLFRCGRPHFLVQNLWRVRTDKSRERLNYSAEIFRTRGRVYYFAILCGRLFWSAFSNYFITTISRGLLPSTSCADVREEACCDKQWRN